MRGGARRTLALLLIALWLVPAAGEAADPRTALRAERERQRVLAGHLLRRVGFGPTRREMHEVLRVGTAAFIEQQLSPEQIDDRIGERRFHPPAVAGDDGLVLQLRWLTRMASSRRQLQEKMTLHWHEHFATSLGKVGAYTLMRDQEQLFRALALGRFRDLLIGVTRDNAMLIYLDNSYNNGQATDDEGNRVPPNENYARELLQLFALGVHRLNMDGTLALDAQGKPIPAYTEADVKEVARALTGWYASYPEDPDEEDPTQVIAPATYDPYLHDPGEKIVLGALIAADEENGAADVERVVDILMQQPTMAPFVAKELILKFATESPTPAYVARVATVFAATDGDLRATMRALLNDAEFSSPAAVRTQYKTPIEHVVGMARGLDARGRGQTLYYWTLLAGQLVYYPPSVFSFYRPGQKGALVNAAYAVVRDQAADMLASSYVDDDFFDTSWDSGGLVRRHRLRRQPSKAVDMLARDLLAAPLSPAVRQAVLDYVGPRVTAEKLRGAAWLIFCSPDFQVN